MTIAEPIIIAPTTHTISILQNPIVISSDEESTTTSDTEWVLPYLLFLRRQM